jgi:hypothetical protein
LAPGEIFDLHTASAVQILFEFLGQMIAGNKFRSVRDRFYGFKNTSAEKLSVFYQNTATYFALQIDNNIGFSRRTPLFSSERSDHYVN